MMVTTNGGGRTAHVSAVPRTNKVKVSGGTQTCSADLQAKIPPNTQHRSFSLTGPGAAQLSQSIRERLSTGSHSLPKPGSELHVFQHRCVTLCFKIFMLFAYMLCMLGTYYNKVLKIILFLFMPFTPNRLPTFRDEIKFF